MGKVVVLFVVALNMIVWFFLLSNGFLVLFLPPPQDITPLCTPSVLERRKSQVRLSDEEDNEVIVKLPPGLGHGSDDEEDGSEEEVDIVIEGEEPSEGDKSQ